MDLCKLGSDDDNAVWSCSVVVKLGVPPEAMRSAESDTNG